MKELLLKSLAPHALVYLSNILEMLMKNKTAQQWLQGNPVFLSLLYCGAEWLDQALGDEDKNMGEIAIDELKEATMNIAADQGIESVELW